MCGLFRKLITITRTQSGVAYLEFAITLPFLLVLFMGGVDLTRYILISQKVEKVATTIDNIVTQETAVTTSGLNDVTLAASQVMQPYSFGANGYVLISSVSQSGTNSSIINWQYGGGGTWTKTSQIGTTGNVANLPNNFTLSSGENVIVTEVYYNFTPLIPNSLITASTIYQVNIFKPRIAPLVTLGSS